MSKYAHLRRTSWVVWCSFHLLVFVETEGIWGKEAHVEKKNRNRVLELGFVGAQGTVYG